MLHLIGDIYLVNKQVLRFIQGENAVTSTHGVSSWWIPLNDDVGLKIQFIIRFPRSQRRYTRTTSEAEVQQHVKFLWEKWLGARKRLNGASEYLPEVYTALPICHTGLFRMHCTHTPVYEENVYYPAFLMKRYWPVREVPEETLIGIQDKFDKTDFLFRHRAIPLWRNGSCLHDLGQRDGKLVILDLVDRERIKYL